MHPMLLQDVKPAKKKIRVGNLDGFFQVSAIEETKANMLSFAEIEDKFNIMYVRGRSFMVNMSKQDIVFEWKNKLYAAEWRAEDIMLDMVINVMVQENKRLYERGSTWGQACP
jgi:hypothetical protein